MEIRNSWLCVTPIAHRGLHNQELPENSLPAFENAAAHGLPIEIDVRLTDDSEVVVFHDDKLTRMTSTDGYVSNTSKSALDEKRLIDGDGKPTENKIPGFEEVLTLINGRVPLLIETKNAGKVGPLESKVAQMLRAYHGDFALQSFNPYSMGYFKDHAEEFLRGQLAACFKKEEMSGYFKRLLLKRLKLNKVSKPDFISYHFCDLPNKFVTKTDLPVLAWTIRSNADYERVKDYCDNIIFEKFVPEQIRR